MSSTDAKPGYDPSDRLNSPDTDWLEEFHNAAINRHRAELAAATDITAAVDKAVGDINAGIDVVEDAVEEKLDLKEPEGVTNAEGVSAKEIYTDKEEPRKP